jgi:hypothetical protein
MDQPLAPLHEDIAQIAKRLLGEQSPFHGDSFLLISDAKNSYSGIIP